ncbi:uncharacterized protein LOC111327819 [Stylophora pistillata]|nr:uncharacterized protein LOC111327819 [Stylophora pistillata]
MIAGGIVLLVVIVIAIAGVLVWHVKRKNRSRGNHGARVYYEAQRRDNIGGEIQPEHQYEEITVVAETRNGNTHAMDSALDCCAGGRGFEPRLDQHSSPNQSGNDRIYHNKCNEDERNMGNSRQKPNINHTPVWKKHKNLDKTSEIHINLLNKKTDGQRFDGANRNADEKEKHVTAPSLSSDTKRGAEENDDDDGSGTCGPDKPVQCTDDIGSKGT